MLPLVFLGAAAVMLLLVLLAIWQSVRAAATGVVPQSSSTHDARRATLLDEKIALLRSIKDLEFEHNVGKISDADFHDLDSKYRARAKVVLKELDSDLGPYLVRANALIDEKLASVGAAIPNAEVEVASTTSGLACASCGTSNDSDSVFCKKCGTRMHREEPVS